MAYNKLSGTVVAPSFFGPAPGEPLTTSKIVGILSGTLEGDAANIEGVPRIVANAYEDNLVTIGTDDNHLVGENSLKFNGGLNVPKLSILGEVSASANVSASVFYGSAAGLTDLPPGMGGDGPSGSIQVMSSGGGNAHISGTTSLLFRNNVLTIGGSLALQRRSLSGNGTASVSDYLIAMDSTNSPVGLQLQKAINISDGQILIVKDTSGTAQTNNITINASGSDEIDGKNSIVLESPYASIQLFCDGANKYFIY